ncbi:uncharacterized protein [Gossypium hirsutum]|uniref:Uncharacterized protein n=1 Tax=Gossypium hirsutum TaxID=3635 RepID=A0A1U8J497_GOSHI|nr:uncharacterized protein LOC107903590 [Gossypium hirsutum]
MPSNGWALAADRPSAVPPQNRRPKKHNKRVFKSPASRRLESRVLEPPRAPGLGLRIHPSDPGRRRRENLRRRSQRAIQGVRGQVRELVVAWDKGGGNRWSMRRPRVRFFNFC